MALPLRCTTDLEYHGYTRAFPDLECAHVSRAARDRPTRFDRVAVFSRAIIAPDRVPDQSSRAGAHASASATAGPSPIHCHLRLRLRLLMAGAADSCDDHPGAARAPAFR